MEENQNIALVKKIYRDFLDGDMPSVLGAFADDIDWNSRVNWRGAPGELAYVGHRLGRSDVARAFEAFIGEVRYEKPMGANQYIVAGDRVIVSGQDIRRVLATGELTENRWSMVWTIANGKVVHFRIYQDTVPVLEE